MGEEHFGLKKNYYKYVARHWYASYTNLNDDYSKRSICSKMNLEKSWLSFYGNYCCLVAKSCPTLGDPMDCSPAGSSVHGISQARKLEWVAISFSRRSSWLRDRTQVSCIGRQVLYHWAFTGNLIMTGRFKSIYWSSHLADAIISSKKRTNKYPISLHP